MVPVTDGGGGAPPRRTVKDGGEALTFLEQFGFDAPDSNKGIKYCWKCEKHSLPLCSRLKIRHLLPSLSPVKFIMMEAVLGSFFRAIC